MFVLNNPFISDFLKNFIIKNKYPVLNNKVTNDLFKGYKNLLNDNDFIEKIKQNPDFKLYTNSEDSIEWIFKNLHFSKLPSKINLFKDKIKFRNMIKSIYPDFYFKEISLDDIGFVDEKTLKYPLILKPAIGFLSFGVYPIQNEKEFQNIRKKLKDDVKKFKGIFPIEVVDTSKFIMEEMIKGEEYAVDVYFGLDGKPVILNIFKHPFFDENDVSDRVYFTSKEIVKNNLKRFTDLFEKIGKLADLKNFTAHIELRANGEKVIPIEVNPMRFTGWCITDLANFAYGINPYEFYMNEIKPDWENILKNTDDSLYYFICAEVPNNIDKLKIKNVNYEKFLSKLDNVIDLRKQDFKTKPLFAIVFGKTNSYNKIKEILSMDLKEFFEMKK